MLPPDDEHTSASVVEPPQTLVVEVGHGGAVAGGRLVVREVAVLVIEVPLLTLTESEPELIGTMLVDVTPLLTEKDVELETDIASDDCAVDSGILAVGLTLVLTDTEVDDPP